MAKVCEINSEGRDGRGSGRPWRFVFDIGGTFTDVVAADAEGRIAVDKCLTRPDDITRAVVEGFLRLSARENIPPEAVQEVVSGATTVVANLIIERKGAPTGLITTAGFADVIEFRQELRYDVYDLTAVFPDPLVPRHLRREVPERVDAEGNVITPLDEIAVRDALRDLAADGVTSVAVCFLQSYRYPAHEERVGAIAAEVAPDLFISLSSEVLPEIREYDRTVATALNAYVRPNIGAYLRALERALKGAGIDATLRIMQSNGGIISRRFAEQQPLRMLESGPAAGALAAAHTARAVGLDHVLSFDMGGTTAKTCLVSGGEPDITTGFETARVHRFKRGSGLPVRLPAIDMIEIGAGGGSIARIDQTGLLKVGPESAGADPGPACYGLGGVRPTVTDAAVVLGYLDPEASLGGAVAIRPQLAEQAIRDDIAGPLGIGVVEAASGIHRIVCETMASAAKIHAVEKGRDVRRYAMVAFGGAGPMHAREVARRMNCSRIVVPPDAGVFSAIGLLVAPAQVDAVRSRHARLGAVDWDAVGRDIDDMRGALAAVLRESDATEDAIAFRYSADMRYVGQGFEINVPLGNPRFPMADDEVVAAFHRAYAGRFGHHLDDVAVEALSWRVEGAAPAAWAGVTGRRRDGEGKTKKNAVRPVYFPDVGDFIDTPVIADAALGRPQDAQGPVVIEQSNCTIVIGPGDRYSVDAEGNLMITLAPGSGAEGAADG